MNILVYSGEGVSRASLAHTLHSLRSFVSHQYNVLAVEAEDLLNEPWEDSTSLLIFPGGRDLPYTKDLNGPANDRIKAYVQSGGRFFGICAGGYYGSDRITFEAGTALEVTGPRELEFFPGECRGAAYTGFDYNSERGARAARIQLDKRSFEQENLGFKETRTYFNGGGFFVDAEKYKDTRVLAWYRDDEEEESDTIPIRARAAIVACRVGRGLAILSGVHPEYDASLLDPDNLDYGPHPNVVTNLLATNHDRKQVLKCLLKRLGLELDRQDTTIISTVGSLTSKTILSTSVTREVSLRGPARNIDDSRGDIVLAC